ncbi:STAM-binding protein-like [Pecten maximus]|uniref:STAM-binding protein-like n=1 Tax=Pecten maximus TaxID=6579 RepID=UPI001458D5C4|nr:STAM-binding protein-like [Pecten maximus]
MALAMHGGDSSLFSDIRDPGARVRKLCDYACQVEVDTAIPPKRYLRSGLEMIRMAKVYDEEGNIESAFVLYTKFISLFVEKLPKHPEFKSAPSTDIAAVRQKVKLAFPVAEQIKGKLTKKYAEIERKRQAEERKIQEELERQQDKIRQEEELRRRQQEEEENCLRLASEAKWMQEQEHRLLELKEQEMMKNIDSQSQIHGPAVANNADKTGLNNQNTKPSAPHGALGLAFIPNNLDDGRPKIEKNLLNDPSRISSSVPNIPDRELKKNLVISDSDSRLGPPGVDRTSKPAFDHFTSIGVPGHNKGGLRDVFIPSDLVRKFLGMAEHNTMKNIETCGILAGKLSKNAFYISDVLIPKQAGTSDSCVAEDEEDILMYQDPRDLITLGWIHTHPSQTAFLSSVDMHNQYGYQAMLPEAIAIVCAPKFNETGIFTLTQDTGMPDIGNCRERGFHDHRKTPPLFESCSNVKILDEMRVEMADLRK